MSAENLPTPIHEITYQGNFLKWKYPEWHPRKPPLDGRGECWGFSDASRLRMLSAMSKVNWDAIGKSLFITLTYQDCMRPEECSEVSTQRFCMQRYIETRIEKEVSILWRVEWAERKTGAYKNYLYPHIHLLVFDVQYIHYAMVNRWWKMVIGYPQDRYVRTETRGARNRRLAWHYLAKYCGKHSSLVIGAYLNNAFPGRSWGIMRKNRLPMHDLHKASMPDTRWIQEIYGEVVGDAPRNKYGNKSFTLLGNRACEVGDILFGMHLDGEIESV